MTDDELITAMRDKAAELAAAVELAETSGNVRKVTAAYHAFRLSRALHDAAEVLPAVMARLREHR